MIGRQYLWCLQTFARVSICLFYSGPNLIYIILMQCINKMYNFQPICNLRSVSHLFRFSLNKFPHSPISNWTYNIKRPLMRLAFRKLFLWNQKLWLRYSTIHVLINNEILLQDAKWYHAVYSLQDVHFISYIKCIQNAILWKIATLFKGQLVYQTCIFIMKNIYEYHHFQL